MPAVRTRCITLFSLLFALALPAKAAVVYATWNSATDIPVSASSYTATGNTVNFTLNFAPATGTNLTVVNNTGLPFISGTFDNLAQGQAVALSYGGATYNFVAHYYGGTGNDVVLVWANSRALAWGYNYDGELGNGSTNQSNVMVPVTATGVLAGKVIVALTQGSNHSLALCSDGTVASWGYNLCGQLGNNSTTKSLVPVLVNTASGVSALFGKTVVAVAVGYYQSMALCSDGSVATWGYNGDGELGDNTTVQRNVPVAVNTASGVSALSGKTVVAISMGSSFSMVLCSDGTLASWGYNSGSLGNNTLTNSQVPVAVNTTSGVSALFGKTVARLSAGDGHCMALCTDGTLVAWGDNSDGQLGDGTTTYRTVPVVVNTVNGVSALSGNSVVSIAAGSSYSLALCSNGTVAAWGANYNGQLGDATTTSRSVPVAVNTASGVSALFGKTAIAIAAGESSNALCADGSMATWGYNYYGQLGNNATTNSAVPVAVSTSPLMPGESLMSPSISQTSNVSMVLAAEPPSGATTLAAVTLSGTSAVLNGLVSTFNSSVNASFDYGISIAYGSSIAATPATVTGNTPTAVTAALTGLLPLTTYHFRAHSGGWVGSDQTFTTPNNDASLAALTINGGAMYPSFTSSTTSYTSTVSTTTSSITVTPTLTDSNATLTVNGVSTVSGDASTMNLAYGTNVIRVLVTAQDGVAVQSYALAVTRPLPATIAAEYASGSYVPLTSNALISPAGSTMNFTLNFAPPTGTNLTVVNNTGLPFINGTFDNLAQGQAVALSYNGVTYNYVANYYGGTGNDLVLVWANNRVFGWGNNSYGGIGDGTTTQRNVMVPVTAMGVLAGKTIVALSQGSLHSLALCSDGTVASWGGNFDGQLGNNTTTNSSVPVLVNTASGVSALYGKKVVAVAAGAYHSMALCSDGTIASWGYNYYGGLGDNTTTQRNVPVSVNTANGVSALAGKTVVAIAAGEYYSMALCSDGGVVTWGDNRSGALGDNTTTQRNVPVAVNAANGVSALYGKAVVSLAAGSYHCLALCSENTVVAWGSNSYGQLGDNTTTQRNVPVTVNTANGVSALYGKTVVNIAAGTYHSLALCSNGAVVAWGSNDYGQLGDTTNSSRSVPVAVNMTSGISFLSGKTAVAIAAVGYYGDSSVALCADGTMASWGSNGNGDLGNNSTIDSFVPVAVNISPLAAGERLMSPSNANLATGALALVAEPPPGVTTLAAASLSGTSATLNGLVSTFNTSVNASFDYGLTTGYGNSIAASPATVTGNTPTAVKATLTGLLPLTTYHFRVNDGVYVGNDLTFTTPNNDASLAALTTSAGSLSPSFTGGTTSYTATVSTATTSCSVTPILADSNATVSVNGVGVNSGSPSAVSLGYGTNVIPILVTAQDGVASQNYTLAVTRPLPTTIAANYASGSDVPLTSNALISPAGSTVNFSLNYAPATGTNLLVVNNTGLPFINGTFDNLAQGQAVVLSYNGVTYHFVANYYGGTGNDLVLVWANNRALAWGYNSYGQVGDGTTTQRLLPTPVSSAGVLAGRTIVAVATGEYHALALCSDGTIAAWGNNSYGQLGNNSTSKSSVPVAVSAVGGISALYGKTVVAVAAGYYHSMALCSDGTIASWGENNNGQLGNNSLTNSSVPVAVNSASAGSSLYGKSIVAVSAGAYHNIALCSDGTLAAWGRNSAGQLGDNTTTQRNVPIAVNAASGISALYGKSVLGLAAGSYHSMALCVDGTLVAWGDNGYGEIGDGTATQRNVPAAVNTASGISALNGKIVVDIAAGGSHSLALCSDGTMAAWGENSYGEFGNNTASSSSSFPVTVNAVSGISALYGKNVMGLASGEYHSMALCSDGSLAVWGDNENGEIGDNTLTQRNAPVLVNNSTLAAGEGFTAISGSFNAHNWSLAVAAEPAYATVATQAATIIGRNSAVLNGIVVPANDSMAVSFDYGTTVSYGTNVAATPSPVSSGAATTVTAAITGLSPGTTYHFRVNGANSSGTLYGTDQTFTTLNNNAALANLVPNSGAVSPVFDPATFSYTMSVPYLTSTLALTPTLADTNAQVTVNGLVVASGSSSSNRNLVEGSNAISIVVTAQDGTTVQTYTLTVTRATGPVVSDLGLSSGVLSPAFVGTASNYTVTVPSATTSLTVAPTWADSSATVTINGVSTTSGAVSGSFTLNYGNNTAVSIVITAADGVSKRTYTLTLNRPLVATYSSSTDVPLTSNGFTATGGGVNFALNYAPAVGSKLTVVNNTGAAFISGTFSNLAQGQAVALAYNGISYNFVANYFGGTGNDLVLQWANSSVFAWGANSSGQLGDVTTVQRNLPVPVSTSAYYDSFTFTNYPPVLFGKTVISGAAGTAHSLGLCSDGTLVAWGDNSYGQVGGSTPFFQKGVPVAVYAAAGSSLTGKKVAAIAAGAAHSMALCSDGTVSTWGNNSVGQLGINQTVQFPGYPVAVSTSVIVNGLPRLTALYGKKVVSVSAGQYHCLALCSDGTLAAWGYNGYGQLGINSTSNFFYPVPVNTASGVSALFGKTVVGIAAGGSHSMALCSDGTLVAWGGNSNGQLGDTTTTLRKVPVAVNTSAGTSALAGKSVVAISGGLTHSLVLCSDGTIAAWGGNASGQLGDTTLIDKYAPVSVSTAAGSSALAGKTVTGITASASSSFALCSDGTLVAWGSDSSGQLGDNSTTNESSAVTVNSSPLALGAAFSGVFGGSSASHTLALVVAPQVPVVSTLAATVIAGTSVTLNGNVNAWNNNATVAFDYGTTTAYGTTLSASPATVTGGSSTAVSSALTGLASGTTYHFRINGVNALGTTNGSDLTFTTLPNALQSWRQTNFGTMANSGSTADASDYDNDGIPNLIEWACNLDPTTRNALPATVTANGASFAYTYSRSTAAANTGTSFVVEWSNTLAAGSWSSSGVVQTVLSDDGTTQQVQAVIPITTESAKFVHLSVTAPP